MFYSGFFLVLQKDNEAGRLELSVLINHRISMFTNKDFYKRKCCHVKQLEHSFVEMNYIYPYYDINIEGQIMY